MTDTHHATSKASKDNQTDLEVPDNQNRVLLFIETQFCLMFMLSFPYFFTIDEYIYHLVAQYWYLRTLSITSAVALIGALSTISRNRRWTTFWRVMLYLPFFVQMSYLMYVALQGPSFDSFSDLLVSNWNSDRISTHLLWVFPILGFIIMNLGLLYKNMTLAARGEDEGVGLVMVHLIYYQMKRGFLNVRAWVSERYRRGGSRGSDEKRTPQNTM